MSNSKHITFLIPPAIDGNPPAERTSGCTRVVYATPNIYELTVVVLEAGYYKLPSVETNVEEISKIVLDNKTGLLVPSNDSIALANALEKLILNEELRINLGENAKKWVTEQFPASKMVDEYKKIYQFQL